MPETTYEKKALKNSNSGESYDEDYETDRTRVKERGTTREL